MNCLNLSFSKNLAKWCMVATTAVLAASSSAQVLLPNSTTPNPQKQFATPNRPQPSIQGTGPTLSEQLGPIELDPPRSIERLPPLWPYYFAGAVVGLLLLVGLIIFYLRRKRREKPVPIIPSDILALQSLDALRPLIDEAKAREFSFSASETVRVYIESRFGLKAVNQTTREFLDMAARDSHTLSDEDTQLLDQFLGYCDLAKFAKQVFTPNELKSMYESARQFVERTRPSIMVTQTGIHKGGAQ